MPKISLLRGIPLRIERGLRADIYARVLDRYLSMLGEDETPEIQERVSPRYLSAPDQHRG